VKCLKYRSERKDKREESKQPVDGGAHETCKGEDERATGGWSRQAIFPSPSPSSSPPPSYSPSASLHLHLLHLVLRLCSSLPLPLPPTPTDLYIVQVRSLPLVAPPFVSIIDLKAALLSFSLRLTSIFHTFLDLPFHPSPHTPACQTQQTFLFLPPSNHPLPYAANVCLRYPPPNLAVSLGRGAISSLARQLRLRDSPCQQR
jgi:hypothetical protein